jgi:TonB-linked SusC/RagA family outer membrane protein
MLTNNLLIRPRMKKYCMMLFLSALLFTSGNLCYAQNNSVIVNGKVKDKATGETLVGVNVVEVDQNGRFISGTTTDVNGNFSLMVSSPNAVIQVSYLGYATQIFELDGRSRLNVTMEEESALLEEVVITAERIGNDGIIAVRDRATAVSRLEMKEMDELMTTTVEDMLMGRIGNVDISAISGDPGAGLNIRIRGTATLNARNNPLILVNGIPYDPNIEDDFDFATADIERFGNLIDVSPEDIESIEVLKDAASTALWGSKAANGILSIKTKRGRKSKPVFNYTYKLTRSTEPEPIPMLNGAEYVQLIKIAQFNHNAISYTHYTIDPEVGSLDYYNYSQNTNWIEEITQTAYTMQHNFSVRGGGDKARYDLSVGYNDEEGTTIGTGLKKLTLRTALDYDISDKLKFKTDVLFTRYDQDATYDVEDWDYRDKRIRSVAYKKMPNMSVYERDTANNVLSDFFTPANTLQGNSKDVYNPVAFAELASHKRYQDNTRTRFNLRHSVTDQLILDGEITLDLFDRKNKKFLPYEAIGYNYNDDITNQAMEEYHKKTSIQTRERLIYTPRLGDRHDLSTLLQVFTENSVYKDYTVKTSRSASIQDQDPTGDKKLVSFSSGSSTFRYLSGFLQLHYKYLDKYIITLGILREGSSRFSPDSRYGFFPSVSTAWRLSGENFMQLLSFINDFKLRCSWGVSGNAPDKNYLYFNKYSASASYAYNGIAGVRPSGVELTGLQWETVEQLNPGVSLLAFNNRLNIEVDYYNKHTRNLYLPEFEIPTHSGYSKIDRNSGEMVNRGWEFMTDVRVVDKTNWKISFNLNLSANENLVLKMPENYKFETGDMLANGNYRISIVPGKPIGGFFGYEYLGVYKDYDELVAVDINGNQIYDINGTPLYMIHGGSSAYEFQPGDAKYKDQNYDGVINELDLTYLGDLNPDLMGGFGPRIEYRGIVLNAYFYFKLGQKIINQTKMDTEKMYDFDNQSKATNWRWRNPGDETDVPRALYNMGFNWMGSGRFVEDGSFLRLRTASLTYNFPETLCSKINFREIRIYATAYNLFTWTSYSGQDPDVAQPSTPSVLPKDISRTPPSKKVIFGVTVSF